MAVAHKPQEHHKAMTCLYGTENYLKNSRWTLTLTHKCQACDLFSSCCVYELQKVISKLKYKR